MCNLLVLQLLAWLKLCKPKLKTEHIRFIYQQGTDDHLPNVSVVARGDHGLHVLKGLNTGLKDGTHSLKQKKQIISNVQPRGVSDA